VGEWSERGFGVGGTVGWVTIHPGAPLADRFAFPSGTVLRAHDLGRIALPSTGRSDFPPTALGGWSWAVDCWCEAGMGD